MFSEIIRFEIRYRLRRPATYVYFLLMLSISFLFVAVPSVSFTDAADQLQKNSPMLITQLMMVIMVFGSLVVAAIMGVPVYRDYEHRFNEIMHTLPIRKADYLWGRFLGSFIITALIFAAIPLAMAVGFAMPWQEKDTIGAFQLPVYLNAYFLFILPNAFVLGSLFFIVGSYFRSQVAIYAQGVAFIVLYFAVEMMLGDSERSPLYSLFDPFGVEAISQITKYWTVHEKNTLTIGLENLILYNRMIWISLAVILSVIFNWRFSFSVGSTKSHGLKRKMEAESDQQEIDPVFEKPFNENRIRVELLQWWYLSSFYFKSIIRSIPFIIMILCGIGLIALVQFSSTIYGITSLPVTYMLLDNLHAGFVLFAIIIITVYSGELIWKEIGNRFFMILDSSPLSNQQIMLSKFTAIVLVELLLAGVIMATGITIQISQGFYEFQLMVYIKYLLLNFMPLLVLMTLLTFLIHTLVNNKFLGHGIVILFYVLQRFYTKLGIQHNLLHYADAPSQSFSGMNGFQKFTEPALWFNFYWLMLGIVFFSLSILFIKRGTARDFRTRLNLFRNNWRQSRIKYVIYGALILFVTSGSAIYYNTNVLNTYRSQKKERRFKADYERTYSRYKNSPQPRITDVTLNVAIYPEKFGITAEGRYVLVNKDKKDIDSLHLRSLPEVKINSISFGRDAVVIHEAPEYGYTIFLLKTPLKPGDSLICKFNIAYWEKGFAHNGRGTEIVPNGTFFRNEVLPYFGYDESFVITDKKDRKKENLPEREFDSPAWTDSSALSNTYISRNADRIRFEATVSTSRDQIALTCGTLVKEWEHEDRRYFHYKAEQPIWNFFPFLSARYEVIKEKAGNTNIEIYYHKQHKYNLDKMLKAARKTIAYCDSNYSPFRHQDLRIVEFPRYFTYAQSFAGIIPFSEGVGFIVDIDDENDIDLPFYITAHEIAHQWWGHEVCAADVKGKLMLVESLANYTALMVMEKEFGRENMHKFLRYEQNKYLLGRSLERKKEVPLNLVDNQSYIAYEKGSVALYALSNYAGENRLNKELSSFLNDYSYRESPYPTSVDLINYLNLATPDSVKYLIDDLFKNITIFSNRIDSASFSINADGGYDVLVSAKIQKFRADSLGAQTELSPRDWLDLGVFTEGSDGKDSLIFITKVKVDTSLLVANLSTGIKPTKVGIDPLHLMIDRNLEDNIKAIKQ